MAVYSEADKNALHAALADQSYCIGGPEASESYLNENQIISTAILSGAQAIHPGYGFLSENAHFARLCRENGLFFIGPDPEDMERLSDKAKLKELIRDTGLSVIPGTKAVESVEEAKKEAEAIGYTGDAAYMDENGRYWFHGRFDDIIKTGGFRVGPYEVENVLMEHPAVMECSVIGGSDSLRGQAIKKRL